MLKNIVALSCLFLSTALTLSSQDSLFNSALDEVVVTASKFSTKQSKTGKVVQVIRREDLQNANGRTLSELLNQQAGIFINGANNNLGLNIDVYLRGAGSGNTLILIDGVPVGDPSLINNSFDPNYINTALIDRVEILKGSQSTLWGSDAMAGVINIITKKEANKLSPFVDLSYGSYNTIRANAGISGEYNKLFYSLGLGLTNSKGFSSAYDSTATKGFDKDGFNQNNLSLSLGYKFSNKLSLNAASHLNKYKSDVDAGAFNDDRDYTLDNKSHNHNLTLKYETSKIKINWLNSITNTDRATLDDSTHVGGFAKWQSAKFAGQTLATELVSNIQITSSLNATVGAQYLGQNTDQSYKSLSSFGPYESVPLNAEEANTNNLAGYASINFNVKNKLHTELGFRTNKHNVYGGNNTYSLSASYNLSKNANLFANIASGFKAPSLYQLFSEYGNKNLKPETSQNIDLGFQLAASNYSFRAVAFKRDIENLIIFFTDANFLSFYKNRDLQNDNGIEIEGQITINDHFSFGSQATFIDGEGTEDNVKVDNLYRRPKFSIFNHLTITPIKKLSITPSLRVIGKRQKGIFDAGPDFQPAYNTLNLNARYAISNKYTVYCDLRNITNQEYFDIVGYASRGFNATFGASFKL